MTRRTRSYSVVVASNHLQTDPISIASTSTATTPSISTVINTNHLFYLQNGDNPGMAIVTQLLMEQKYQQWSHAITLALSAKLKLGLIDGSISMPVLNSPTYALWKRCNDMIVSWLLNSISPDIRNDIVYLTTAKAIWDDLIVRFAQSNCLECFS